MIFNLLIGRVLPFPSCVLKRFSFAYRSAASPDAFENFINREYLRRISVGLELGQTADSVKAAAAAASGAEAGDADDPENEQHREARTVFISQQMKQKIHEYTDMFNYT